MMPHANRLSDRAFGFAFAAIFAIVAGIVRFFWGYVPAWAVGVAAVFLVLALARPVLLLPLNLIWHRVAHGIAKCNNFVLLGLFFILFFVSISAIFRVLGKDPMQRTIDKRRESYWMPVFRQADAQTFRDQF